jgi:hypothetical protein
MFQTTDHKNYMTGEVHENCLISRCAAPACRRRRSTK